MLTRGVATYDIDVKQPPGSGADFFLGAAGLLLGFLEIFPRPNGRLARLTALRRHLLIVAWLIVPVLGIYLLSLRQPVFNPHYVIWIAPAAMMLVALGIQLLWNNSGKLAKPLAIILVAYILLFWVNTGLQQPDRVFKPDLRAAVAYIGQDRQADDLLIFQIPHMEFAYRYYSSHQGADPFGDSDERLGRWAPGLFTNNELSETEARRQVDREMAILTAVSASIWLMLSKVDTWDERQLMIDWFEDRAALVDEASFPHVAVRHYRLP